MRTLLFAVACLVLAASAVAKPPAVRPVPEHPVARGTFVQDWLIANWTDARWQAEIRDMKALGMHTIVYGSTVDSKTRVASYPTSVPGLHMPPGAADSVDACLRNAEKNGMRVFVGLNFHGDWWSKGANDPQWLYAQMREGNAIASDLYQRYKAKYPTAFHGWYWVWEVDNLRFNTPSQRGVLARALDISARGLKDINPTMPVMLCPFMNYRLGQPEAYRDLWINVFANCALGEGDIFAPQDCVGAGGLRLQDVSAWFAALKQAVDTKPGLRFWSDAETFIQEDWTAAPLGRFVAQMKAVQPHVDTIITFAWTHYYSPNLVSKGFQTTLAAYVKTGKLETTPPSAPRNVRATRLSNGDIRVTWNSATDNIGVCGYYVFRDGVKVSRNQVPRGQPSAPAPTVFVDKKAMLGMRYSYHVQAYDFAGNVSPNVGPAAVEPARPRLAGGFIQYQNWMMNLSAQDWRKELAAMRAAGMDTIVIQWLANDANRFIPASPQAVDPTRVILEDASRNGMQVFIGLTMDDDWWRRTTEAAYLDGAAQAAIAMAEEAWQRYGAHAAFTGWYIPQEPWDMPYSDAQAERLRGFYRRITDRCHELSNNKPVGCSPFFAGIARPDVVERVYTRILKDSGLDILMPQDSVGARGWDADVEERVVPYFQAFRKACDAAGLDMWSDLESFRLVPGSSSGFVSADMERIQRQLAAEAPYVRRFVTFDFFHYMSPYRSSATRKLYDDYMAYVKETE